MSWTIRKIAALLVCLLRVGHSRRVHNWVDREPSSLTSRGQKRFAKGHEELIQQAANVDAEPVRNHRGALALLLQAPNQAVSFNPNIPGWQASCKIAQTSYKTVAALHTGARAHAPQMAALPTLPVVAALCTLPTCLGFWKSEYGVSYAYGGAMALMGGMVLRAASTPLAAAHAAALLVYGVRLNLFLLWRELNIERFKKFREKIEERAVSRGGRLSRAPFVLSCSFLYACMAAPMMVTTATAAQGLLTAVLVAVSWAGLLLGASGDIVKSYVKAQKGADTLVTVGPYRFFRHPNYTGEQILWTASAMAAFAAAASGGISWGIAGWLSASVIGWAGIIFVLAQATAGLEKRQAERNDPAYQAWKEGTWAGFALKSKQNSTVSENKTAGKN